MKSLKIHVHYFNRLKWCDANFSDFNFSIVEKKKKLFWSNQNNLRKKSLIFTDFMIFFTDRKHMGLNQWKWWLKMINDKLVTRLYIKNFIITNNVQSLCVNHNRDLLANCIPKTVMNKIYAKTSEHIKYVKYIPSI